METKDVLDLLAESPDGVYGIDLNQRVFYWNAAATRILGWQPEDVIGKPCYQVLAGTGSVIIDPAVCAEDCYAVQSARFGKTPKSHKVAAFTKDKQLRWLYVTHVLVPSATREASALIHIFHEMSSESTPGAIEKIVSGVQSQEAQPDNAPPPSAVAADLTARELEVLRLLSQGMGTEALAKQLVVTIPTVRNHIQSILAKLGVHTRLEAVAYASKTSLLPLPPRLNRSSSN